MVMICSLLVGPTALDFNSDQCILPSPRLCRQYSFLVCKRDWDMLAPPRFCDVGTPSLNKMIPYSDTEKLISCTRASSLNAKMPIETKRPGLIRSGVQGPIGYRLLSGLWSKILRIGLILIWITYDTLYSFATSKLLSMPRTSILQVTPTK